MWLEKWDKELGYFSCEQLKVWKFALWSVPFVQSIQRFRGKSTEDLSLITLKSDVKFEEKLTLGSKNDMSNFEKFNVSSGKFENLHFDALLLSVAYKVSAKKVQKNDLSWHWKKTKTLKKNRIFIWKLKWRIWWTLIGAVVSQKLCTLMGYFCRSYVIIFEQKRYRQVVSWKMTYGFKIDASNLMNFHTSSWK